MEIFKIIDDAVDKSWEISSENPENPEGPAIEDIAIVPTEDGFVVVVDPPDNTPVLKNSCNDFENPVTREATAISTSA